ncbi:MAG: hypothetical protein F6K08_24110 [Okeania sp. SIO1H6]|nr:hypothetical protein [Okeania sp. SIO1H6]
MSIKYARGEQSTWGHPEVAVDVAKWVSISFRIQVNRWFIEWSSGKLQHRASPEPTTLDMLQGMLDLLKQNEKRLSNVELENIKLKQQLEEQQETIESVEMLSEANYQELERFKNGHGYWYSIVGYATKHNNESENVTKPEWIRGHYFGAIALLLEANSSLKAVPMTFGLQDGIKTTEDEETTIVERMSTLCVELIHAGNYIILDAFFASKQLIEELRKHNLRLITRVRINAVGKEPLPTPPLKRSRGRPRIWGRSVKMRDLFDSKDCFTTETLLLYGKMVTLRYRAIDLHYRLPSSKGALCTRCVAGG